jgi:hypothetical protein
MIDVLIAYLILGAAVYFAKKYLAPVYFKGVVVGVVAIAAVVLLAKLGVI